MVRKLMLFAVVSFTAFAAIPVAAARPGTPVNAAYQSDSEETTAAPPVVVSLDLGERFEGDGFALEVQDAHIVPSIVRTDYLDIRLAVAFQNLGDVALPFSPVALSGEPGYPTLQLVDDEGVVQELDRRDPYRMAVPGSSLQNIPSGLPAHWTLGFEASSEQASQLTVQAVSDGFVVAEWDVLSTPRPLQGWTAPAGATEADTGDTIAWDDAVTLSFDSLGTVACGLADLVHSATSSYVIFDVENSDVVERAFPAVQYPAIPMIAVWDDGTTARHIESAGIVTQPTSDIVNYNSFAGDLTDDEKDIVTDEFMNTRPGPEFNMVPPQVQNAVIASVFTASRDSRLADVLETPSALYLLPPDGNPVWLDLSNTANMFDTEAEADNPSCGIGTPSVELGTRAPVLQLLELREPAEVVEETDDSLTN